MKCIQLTVFVSALGLSVAGFALSGEPHAKAVKPHVKSNQIGVDFVGKKNPSASVNTNKSLNEIKKKSKVKVNTNQVGVDFTGKPKPE